MLQSCAVAMATRPWCSGLQCWSLDWKLTLPPLPLPSAPVAFVHQKRDLSATATAKNPLYHLYQKITNSVLSKALNQDRSKQSAG